MRDLTVRIVVEARLVRDEYGNIWTNDAEDAAFFRRYIGAFRHVEVVARVANGAAAGRRVDAHPDVSVVPLPSVHSPRTVLALGAYVRSIRRVVQGGDAWILRPPGAVALSIWPFLKRSNKPFGVEVVGDPTSGWRWSASHSPALALLRRPMVRSMREAVGRASVTSYVTTQSLQREYPCGGWSTSYSSIDVGRLEMARQVGQRRLGSRAPIACEGPTTPLQMLLVGQMSRPFKGIDIAIRCVRKLQGLVTLQVVGDGALRGDYERMAAREQVRHLVRFHGRLSFEQLLRHLEAVDIFILPSRREGLPRALLEAMAAGLPCVATDVGGTRELLPDDWVVPVGAVEDLADRVSRMGGSVARRRSIGERNARVIDGLMASWANDPRGQFLRRLAAACR